MSTQNNSPMFIKTTLQNRFNIKMKVDCYYATVFAKYYHFFKGYGSEMANKINVLHIIKP